MGCDIGLAVSGLCLFFPPGLKSCFRRSRLVSFRLPRGYIPSDPSPPLLSYEYPNQAYSLPSCDMALSDSPDMLCHTLPFRSR